MTKKAIYFLLAIIILASTGLVACSNGATNTPAPVTTAAAPATTAKVPTSSSAPSATTAPAVTTAPAPTSTSAATAKPTSADAAKYGGIYKRVFATGPSKPIGYPAEAANDSALWAVPALDRLIQVNKDGSFVPQLAVSWNVAPDGKSLIIGLRKGVKFHDGSDFNAAVVKWNLDTQIAAKKTTEWQSIDVVDDYTIRINIAAYKNTMLATLAGPLTQIISKVSFDKNGAEWARWNPVGAGPFIFESYVRDSLMTFKRNPNYWDTGKPYLDGLKISVIPDSTVRQIAFQKGDIQRVAVSGISVQELQKAGFAIVTEPAGTFTLIPNSKTAASPWANIKVRQAASYAIDREGIAQALGFGLSKPAYQLYPGFAQTAIPDLPKTGYDQAKAKQLLKDAGYPTGFKTVMHNFSVIPTDNSTAVANQLREVGINIEVDNPTAGKYTELRYGNWDGLMHHGFNSYSNFVSMSDYFLYTQFPNLQLPAGFKEALEAAALTKEPDPKLIQKAVRILYDDTTVIPYMEETRVTFLQKGVHDPATSYFPLSEYLDKEVWLDASAR